MGKSSVEKSNQEFFADTMDLDHKEQKNYTYLNTQKDAFQSVFSEGINRAEGLFDKTAIFHTGR